MNGHLNTDESTNGIFHESSETTYSIVPSNSLESDESFSEAHATAPTELEFEQLTSSTIALENQLNELGLLKDPQLKQTIEKILHASQASHHNFAKNLDQGLKTVRQRITDIIRLMQREQNLESLFQVITDSIQKLLRADRVLIYRFDKATQGTVITESLAQGWTPSFGESLDASYFGLKQDQAYQRYGIYAINDLQEVTLSPHQRQLMAQFQTKSSLSQAITLGNEVWGLLVAQQCRQSRQWQQHEVEVLQQVSRELVIRLQPKHIGQQFQRRINRETTLSKVVDQILRSTDVQRIYSTTVREVRRFLDADRVGVFQFYPDSGYDDGEFVAEDVVAGFPSAIAIKIHDHCFGNQYADKYRSGAFQAVADIHKAGLSKCHIDILSQFDIRANLIVPLLKDTELWGLLCVHQCRGPREWQADEIAFLKRVAAQFSVVYQQAEYLQQTQLAAEREKTIASITEKMLASSDIQAIYSTTVRAVRRYLNADRVGVFQFYPNSGYDDGEFVAEDVAPGFPSALAAKIHDHCFGNQYADKYRDGAIQSVADIHNAGLSDCHISILSQFDIRANLIVPLLNGYSLWGLLCVHQCRGPREWKKDEIEFVRKVGAQFSIARQQASLLAKSQQTAERERVLNQTLADREKGSARIIDKIVNTSDLTSIFKTTTQEVSRLLNIERVTVYKFRPDFFGDFIEETVVGNYPRLVGSGWEDPYLNEHQGGRFRKNEPLIVDDIHGGETHWTGDRMQPELPRKPLTDCHVEALEYYQVGACVVVSIFQGEKLWGLLSAFQNTGTRQWQEGEVQLLMRIANQLGIALRHAKALEESQAKTEQLQREIERAQALSRVVNRIRNTLDLDTIFNASTQEVRNLLKVERVTIYKFRSDFYGDFMNESVTGDYPSLVGSGWEDPYLNEHQGGRFRQNIPLVVNDIHVGEILWENGRLKTEVSPKPMTDCHVEALEGYQVKACAVVSIFQGNKLWGLLSAFQNSAAREWEEAEINLLIQVATQIGNGIQQAEYAKELQIKSEQLAEAAAREKASKELLQQRAVNLLMAVRPALDGDLTVRAPLTEDEMGTVADAYNNTIQSLRRLVSQVKEASQEVTLTSQTSESEIRSLSEQTQQGLDEINNALGRIQSMIDSNHLVDASAHQVETAVQQANQTVQEGDQAMNRAVEGILVIRETVAETTKKIKRLSESSQKVSKVVRLIDNFTTQTNLLALNASIEATRAGEYGKGFAVVADEVRLLAQQSAEATAEIEKLIQGIQSETSEVSEAMETGIEQVVRGTELVTETRSSLNAIVDATKQISELVAGITQATQTQTQQSESVTQIMNRLTETANQTSKRSAQITNSFQHLLQTSQTLQDGVGQFKVD
ncbi:MAG: GAF domain-containing protein [Elainellaceae cyanobacterium]